MGSSSMNLFHETTSFSAWLAEVIGTFLIARPATTLVVISVSSVARVMKLLNFFLPLKVILLAASDGVPSYFPFIDPVHKLEWIVGLSISTFVWYGITLGLEALANRLSQDASSKVMQGAKEMIVLDNQGPVVQSCYTRVCQVCSNLLFVILGSAVMALLNLWLFLLVAGLSAIQFLLTSWVVGRGDEINPGPLKLYVTENLGNYLRILLSVNFLLGFVVILIPFLAGGGNILVAILSILVLRQVLDSLVAITNEAVRLAKDKHRITPLVFRGVPLEMPEHQGSRSLRHLFLKANRQDRSGHVLSRAIDLSGDVDVRWSDSDIPSVNTMVIIARGSRETDKRYFQQQIFPPKALRQLENEEFLFRHIPRSRLKAPEILAHFKEGPFECQICDYGLGQVVPADQWRPWKQKLLNNAWGCQPTLALIAAYSAARPLMHHRLSNTLIDRLIVAVDSDEEAGTLSRFRDVLPAIHTRLQSLPLYVYNPDLSHRNTVIAGDDEVLAMTWGRWSLEPLGGGPNDLGQEDQLVALLPLLRTLRTDLPATLMAEDIRLSGHCRDLEVQIGKQQYKAALHSVEQILHNHDALHATRAA
jgi:hypothetical protein